MGRVLGRHRDRVHIQVHIGALYSSGAYGWTTDAKPAIAEFEQRLAAIGTDYADFGFIHCIDEDADLDHVMNGGIWDYAQARKADGTIRHLAFSTHSLHIARELLATGSFDLVMFSLNPMYDYTDESEYGQGEAAGPLSCAFPSIPLARTRPLRKEVPKSCNPDERDVNGAHQSARSWRILVERCGPE